MTGPGGGSGHIHRVMRMSSPSSGPPELLSELLTTSVGPRPFRSPASSSWAAWRPSANWTRKRSECSGGCSGPRGGPVGRGPRAWASTSASTPAGKAPIGGTARPFCRRPIALREQLHVLVDLDRRLGELRLLRTRAMTSSLAGYELICCVARRRPSSAGPARMNSVRRPIAAPGQLPWARGSPTERGGRPLFGPSVHWLSGSRGPAKAPVPVTVRGSDGMPPDS